MLITEEIINEAVLTHAHRLKKAHHIRKHSHLLVRARHRAKQSIASSERLTHRARRAARHLIRKMIAGKMGGKYHELSPMQRTHVDRKVEHKKVLINNLAKRLFHKVRQDELVRYKKMKAEKNK